MAKIKVLSGEGLYLGPNPNHQVELGRFVFQSENCRTILFLALKKIKYTFKQIASIRVLDEDTYRTATATGGWGVAGLIVGGPLLAGFAGYFGGKKDNRITMIEFDDGRKVLVVLTANQLRKASKHIIEKQAIEAFNDATVKTFSRPSLPSQTLRGG
jgi:hypothetical protein